MEQGLNDVERLSGTLEVALNRLELARPFAKHRHQRPVLDVTSRLLRGEGGVEAIFTCVGRMDAAGLFAGSDWDAPAGLLPQLVSASLDGPDEYTATLEAVSLLRILAVATGEARHSALGDDHARHFLTQVLALNLRRFFDFTDEAARTWSEREQANARVFRLIAARIGLRDVLGALVGEIWRILEQRPVQVGAVKDMIAQIAIALNREGAEPGAERLGAERLVSALFGPTAHSLDDPGVDAYSQRLAQLDEHGLSREAMGFARSMHDTGLVSDYHVAFFLWALDYAERPLALEAMGLGRTGHDCWRAFRGLVEDLARAAITPTTPQALYGLSELLERGILHQPAAAPALKRLLHLKLCGEARRRLELGFGPGATAETHLLAGALEVIGKPLGIGQGANPTCQSARAIALWALQDPDYLLHLIAEAAERDSIRMPFEGEQIVSAGLALGLAGLGPLDADPVSVLLVPHLDRIYAEMGRRCGGREGDPHRWINPELHGWWVWRGCAVAVDVATGKLDGFRSFVRRFFTTYHPDWNGGLPLTHPQPAGVAFTDAKGDFVGWHAIAILRVARGRQGEMRVYFYNPNNDSGQDWGNGAVVTTSGNGERYGEGSLEFEHFASRLYLFHEDPWREHTKATVSDECYQRVSEMARGSWAAERA